MHNEPARNNDGASHRFSPVDDGHRLAVCTVAIRENPVIDSDELEALDDAEWRTWEDGFDHTRRGDVIFDRNLWNVRRGG